MIDLFFKIGLPVLMIGIITLVSHRYGPAVGGILGAVPAKGGPILLFLALEQNTSFAATSAAASLGGAGGCGVFCLVYALVCRRVSWPIAGAAAYAAFVVTWAVMLPIAAWGLAPAFAATAGLLLVSRRLLPKAAPMPRRTTTASDLPTRMIAGAAMVVFVTTAGPYFGATISGMLATIPTIAAVLALFTHAQEGPDRTIGVMRGMTHGLLGFASFLTVVAATLVPLGVVRSFALAAVAVVVVQFVELRSALRAPRPASDIAADVSSALELPEAAE
ncbi:MAG: hypothetical protein ABSE58_03510 [Candidatus Limnocylindrales bacterium]|jgi:hypothetical protein